MYVYVCSHCACNVHINNNVYVCVCVHKSMSVCSKLLFHVSHDVVFLRTWYGVKPNVKWIR